MAAVRPGSGLVVIQSALTAALANDTGASNSDGITSDDTITGVAQVAGTINFTDENNRSLGSTTVTSGQTYNFKPTTLADGSHTITATEAVGSHNATASVALTYDTMTPAVAITSTGGLTNQPNQTVTGTVMDANPGATVSLYDNGSTTAFATATVQPNGTFAASVTLAQGQNSITAQDTDLAGNTGSSNTVTYTLDTTLSTPTIAFAASNSAAGAADVNAAHAAAAGYTVGSVDADATATVTFTGTLKSGTDGTVAGNGANGTHTVDLSGFRDGTVTASISDADMAGNMRTGQSAQATLDTTPPRITALADSGPGIDGNGNGDIPAGTTVTLTVTTSEPVFVSGGTPTLTLNDGGTAAYAGGSGTNQQTFSYTVAAGQNIAKLAVTAVNANGATVTDQAGNPLNPSIMGAAVPSGTLVVDTTPPAAASVTDTVAQGAGPTPINLAAPSDNLTPAGSLAIAAGALPTDGLVTLSDGTPVASGQALTAAQLTGLLFTPAGAAGQSSAFTYSVTDGAGNASTGTAVLNVGAPNTPPTTTPQPQPAPAPAPDTVTFNDQVYYDQGFLVVSGRAASAAGVSKVEITAQVDGVATDLGAAAVDANGNFSFRDRVGAHTQGFITATETDGANGTASTQADFSLTGGGVGGGYRARQDRYSADGSAVTATDLYKASGAQDATLDAGGLTFFSDTKDVFENGGQPGSTFVFGTGYGRDVVDLFRPDNVDHDTLSFLGSSFDNDIANVLAHTFDDKKGDAVIHDPGTKGDSVVLIGVSKQQFATYAQQDVTFHA